MLTESTLRQRIDDIWSTDMHPVRRAKTLLRMSHQARSLAHFLMKLGFSSHHNRDADRTKRFWAAAAKFFGLEDEIRDMASRALKGARPQVGFGYGPSAYAVPGWDREMRIAPPERAALDN